VARVIPVGFGEAAIEVNGPVGTGPFITTIGVSLIGIATSDYLDLADNILSAYQAVFQAPTSDQCTIDSCTLAVGLTGGTSGSVRSSGASVAGLNNGSMAPSSMAVIGQKASADLGRRGRGRSFLPCMLDRASVLENGQLTPTAVTDYGALWNDFVVALATLPVGSAAAPVILHADGSTPTPITGTSVSPLVGWIRKRIR
jgi:hypothetical protein